MRNARRAIVGMEQVQRPGTFGPGSANSKQRDRERPGRQAGRQADRHPSPAAEHEGQEGERGTRSRGPTPRDDVQSTLPCPRPQARTRMHDQGVMTTSFLNRHRPPPHPPQPSRPRLWPLHFNPPLGCDPSVLLQSSLPPYSLNIAARHRPKSPRLHHSPYTRQCINNETLTSDLPVQV